MITREEKEIVKHKVSKALDSQFETYTWEKMIIDCDLTYEQTKWAKKHLGYKMTVK